MQAIFPLPPPFDFAPAASEADPQLRGRLRQYAIQREDEIPAADAEIVRPVRAELLPDEVATSAADR